MANIAVNLLTLPWTVLAIVVERAAGDCFDNIYAQRMMTEYPYDDEKVFSQAA